MAATMDDIKRLEREGAWIEILAKAMTFLSAASSPADLAVAHRAISAAYFETATTPDDWRSALRHAHAAFDLFEPGTVQHVHMMQRLSSLAVDTRRLAEAKKFSTMFLRHAQAHASLTPYTPYVIRDQAQIAYIEHRFNDAVRLYRRAANLFAEVGNDEQANRTLTNVAWALIRAGRLDGAKDALSAHKATEGDYLRLGAEAVILAHEGRHDEALRVGRAAMRSERLPHDLAGLAELLIVLADVLRYEHANIESAIYLDAARKICARLGWAVTPILAQSEQRGGETLLVTAALSLGSGGLHLDASYSAGSVG